MNIDLVTIGKTDSTEVASLVALYAKRISRWARFGVVMLPDVKSAKGAKGAKSTAATTQMEAAQTRAEGELLLHQFAPDDYVVLLDEGGKEFDSVQFAAWLGRRLAGVAEAGATQQGGKRLCFVVGGPYGFSPEVYARAAERLSLSRMTFSHQIVRAIFAEQLYRAFSILNGEPYHHQ